MPSQLARLSGSGRLVVDVMDGMVKNVVEEVDRYRDGVVWLMMEQSIVF